MSVVTTRKYLRKPFEVEAVQVSLENISAVAKWCSGEIMFAKRPKSSQPEPYVKVRVVHPIHDRQTMAFVGDFVLFANSSFKVYSNRAFRDSFDLIDEEIKDEKLVETSVEDLSPPFLTGGPAHISM